MTFKFYRDEDGSLSLSAAVYQALGAASVCWDDMSGTGVFHDQEALEIGDALIAFIIDWEFRQHAQAAEVSVG